MNYGDWTYLANNWMQLGRYLVTLQSSCVYFSFEIFDDNGKFNEGTTPFIQSFVDTFVELIKKHQAA